MPPHCPLQSFNNKSDMLQVPLGRRDELRAELALNIYRPRPQTRREYAGSCLDVLISRRIRRARFLARRHAKESGHPSRVSKFAEFHELTFAGRGARALNVIPLGDDEQLERVRCALMPGRQCFVQIVSGAFGHAARALGKHAAKLAAVPEERAPNVVAAIPSPIASRAVCTTSNPTMASGDGPLRWMTFSAGRMRFPSILYFKMPWSRMLVALPR